MIVSFIGIGAQKAGTSWLHRHLSAHPEVCSTGGLFDKEIDFFTWRYSRGYVWYESHFDVCEECVAGEFSTGYFASTDAAVRISEYNPMARLLVLLRDPIERAISQHRHEVRKGNIPASHWDFEKAMDANPTYVTQGLYARNLRNYLSVFEKSQIWIGLFEDIIRDPMSVVKSAYMHIGVSGDFVPENLSSRVGDGTYQRSAIINKIAARLGPAIRNSRYDPVISRVASSRPARSLTVTTRRVDAAVPPIRAPVLSTLRHRFESDVRALESLIERDLSHWLDVEAILDSHRRVPEVSS
jgi:hypothetical protein